MIGAAHDLTFYGSNRTRDDQGRWRDASPGTPLMTTRGRVSTPSSTKGNPRTSDIDAVAFVSAKVLGTLDYNMHGYWVRVAGAGRSNGDYRVERVSGGRRIVRVELTRAERQDLSRV